MKKEKIDRINALARKKRSVGLTEAEHAEQKTLYAEYLRDFRSSFTGVLDNTVIERPDGAREKLVSRPAPASEQSEPTEKEEKVLMEETIVTEKMQTASVHAEPLRKKD